ncbi:MAG: dihydrolipoamide acetyltransferase family protein [Verrucomicrobiota bacterium]|jgi:pyruvate dehydrogenase E2 component (dihydrolipoamide acetyltransferase)
MATPIVIPKFGQMTEESAIVQWLKREGDPVAKGDILFTVETDKSVMEVESFAEGTLLKILVQPGVSVPVQTTVGFLGQPGEPLPAVTAPVPVVGQASRLPSAPPPVVGQASRPPPAPPVVGQASRLPSVGGGAEPAPARLRLSPRARRLAAECVIDPARIAGSGPGGRVVEKDVQAYLEARGYSRIRISPAAKQLAAREKLDLLTLAGSGVSGRIGVGDVQRALAERPRPMSKMRQLIAQRLAQSVVTAPHFFVTVEVDMTGLLWLRAQLKEQGAPYTVTDFISQAVVLTLKDFPAVNSSTDGQSIRWHSHVHLGLAVSLEQGLVVPVIRQAEELTLAELSARAGELADKARHGKLAPDEMTGSTFTISNMGMLDLENFTAIINPGEAAILAVASALRKPVVRDGQVLVRSIMKMTLSSDHRLIDGALAARFINAVKQKLEDLALWKLLAA